MTTVYNLVYAEAYLVIKQDGQTMNTKKNSSNKQNDQLPWQRKMGIKINDLRTKKIKHSKQLQQNSPNIQRVIWENNITQNFIEIN